MSRVVISGYYGFGNAGDEAMLTSIIQAMRRRGEFEFTVLSADPARTAREHGVRAVGRTDLFSIRRALIQSDALVSGGGSLLQDVTSPFSVPYYGGLIGMAKVLGRRAIVYGQGIGPLRTRPARWLARAVLNRCDLVTVRDEDSRAELRRLGVTRPPVEVAADPVLSLDFRDSERGRVILREAQVPGSDPLIGVSPRDWRGREDYLTVLAKAVERLAVKTGARVILIPMQHGEDVRSCREMRERMRASTTILEGRYSVEDLLAVFGRLDLVVGMRLHALIFAALSGVPMVGLSYDPKVDAFLRQLGQEPAGTVDQLRLSDLTARLEEAWTDRGPIGEEIRRRRIDLRGQADRSAVLAAQVISGAAFGEKPGEGRTARGEASP